MTKKPLTLTFDPLTIEHLGSNMYSRLPNAVAELVANAYDADATRVVVRVDGQVGSQTITVSDNGHGMSWDDLADKYLRIGRDRRTTTAGDRSEGGRRMVSGKKGLGKLALFGIGGCVKVVTSRAGARSATHVTLDWDVLREGGKSEYRPEATPKPCPAEEQGTAVTVSRLSRRTAISAEDLAKSLSRLFNYDAQDMTIAVVAPDGSDFPVTMDLGLENLDREFSWNIPRDIKGAFVRTLEDTRVVGRVVATEKPLRSFPRGVAVYTSGRLANEPEFFGAADSSYAYAYLTGYVRVDVLDGLKPDVIATDRRAVSWDHVEAAPVHEALRKTVEYIANERRRLRSETKQSDVRHVVGGDVDEWVSSVQGPPKEHLRDVLSTVASDDLDITAEERKKILEGLNGIAPPFANYYWQNLHPWIQDACREHYEKGEYYYAVVKAWNRYMRMVVAATGCDVDGSEKSVLGRAFGAVRDDGKASISLLSVTSKAMSQGAGLRKDTVAALEDGQRDLSNAVASAFRNPAVHEEDNVLDRYGLLTYRQALDALGVISLLCSRLEQAESRDKSQGSAAS